MSILAAERQKFVHFNICSFITSNIIIATFNNVIAYRIFSSYRAALLSITFSSKYGHFRLQKTKMATAKIQTQGFKTTNVTDATSIIDTVFDFIPLYQYFHGNKAIVDYIYTRNV